MSRRKQQNPQHLQGTGEQFAPQDNNGETVPEMSNVDETDVAGRKAEEEGPAEFEAEEPEFSEPQPKRLKLDEEAFEEGEGEANREGENEPQTCLSGQDEVDNASDADEPNIDDKVEEKRENENLDDEVEDDARSKSDESEEDDVNDEHDEDLDEKPLDLNMKAEFPQKADVASLSQILTPAMATLQQFFPFNNVTLEPLETTKQAVAQFAENNLAPSELAMLQSTLYSLQQQQLLQLQLIQQLQQQLVNGMNQQIKNGAGIPPPPTTLPMTLPPNLSHVSSKSPFDPVKPSEKKLSVSRSSNSSPDLHDETSVEHEASGTLVPPHPTEPSTPNNDSSVFISDDPFFKHKCRYCYKVFGSDSALQIHIRSHTGERPFKCNICGNRFSTRGNLKVHFQRHKAKYPHIRMNPNPVPEHLDRIAPPPLIPPSSMPPTMPTFSPHSLNLHAPSEKLREPKQEEAPSAESPVTNTSLAISTSTSSTSPTPAVGSEPPSLTSPDMGTVTANTHSHPHLSPPMPPTPASIPMPVPLPSSLPTISMTTPPCGMDSPFYRGSILPNKSEDPLEQYMEIKKSETSKLQQLVENIETKLTDPNQCVICHRVLSCKSALQMHYRIHTGERPFRCKICGRSFTTKGNLKTHMGVHRAKPPLRMLHQCPVCHKQFTNSLVLQQHIRMHTNDMNGIGFPHADLVGRPYQPLSLYHPPPHPSMQPGGELDLRKPSSGTERRKSSPSPDNRSRSVSPASDNDGHYEDKDYNTTPPPRLDSPSDMDLDSRPIEPGRGIPEPPTSMYSTSLAALEERVRAMDASMAQPRYDLNRPLDMSHHQGDNKQKSDTPLSFASSHNGDRNMMSPVSESEHDSDHPEDRPMESRSPGSRVGSTPPSLSPYPYPTSSGASSPGANFGALDLSQGQERPTTCNVCLKTFACRSALDIHYRSHTKERPYMCEVCDRGFSTRGNMKQHMLTHKIRDLPSQAFNEDGQSEDSQSNSNSNYPVKSEATTPEQKVKREPSSHAPAPPVSAPTTSSDNSPFMRRVNSKHQCQICMKPFSSASALQIHIRTHTGDKPFKCNVCGKAFTTKGNLKVHMGTHMWNNGPSRRGRRIAMEPPIPMPTKEADFMFAHRSPSELYFPYPAFANGLSPKLNEIPVIQSMNGSFPHLGTPTSSAADYLKMAYSPLMSMASPSMHNGFKDSITPPGRDFGTNLSKDSKESVKNNNEGEGDSKVKEERPEEPANWSWKTTCHLCSKVCSSVPALEMHLQSHVMNHNSEREEQKSLMT